jgi:hypothetical protein
MSPLSNVLKTNHFWKTNRLELSWSDYPQSLNRRSRKSEWEITWRPRISSVKCQSKIWRTLQSKSKTWKKFFKLKTPIKSWLCRLPIGHGASHFTLKSAWRHTTNTYWLTHSLTHTLTHPFSHTLSHAQTHDNKQGNFKSYSQIFIYAHSDRFFSFLSSIFSLLSALSFLFCLLCLFSSVFSLLSFLFCLFSSVFSVFSVFFISIPFFFLSLTLSHSKAFSLSLVLTWFGKWREKNNSRSSDVLYKVDSYVFPPNLVLDRLCCFSFIYQDLINFYICYPF